jgi:hypothetical protein
MAHQSESSASRPDPAVVFYSGPGILVTSRNIYTGRGRFPVPDLDLIHCEYRDTRLPRKIALGSGGFVLALAIPLTVVYGVVCLLCAGLVAAGGLGIALAVENRNNPTWMVLVARHQGRFVPLYSTADRREFGRVHRAVLRAVEANEEPGLLPGSDLMAVGAPRGRYATSRARPRPYDRR